MLLDGGADIEGIDKRLNVLDELLNTERDYLRDLSYVCDQYLAVLFSGM